jgi:hypothetical protein
VSRGGRGRLAQPSDSQPASGVQGAHPSDSGAESAE